MFLEHDFVRVSGIALAMRSARFMTNSSIFGTASRT